MSSLIRHLHLDAPVLFLDGITGSGKSMLSPIVASLARVEKQRLEHIYEHICATHYLKRMEADAATSILRIYADLALYNQMISREVNMRPSDDSGIFNNPNPARYVARLSMPDGDDVLRRITDERPILQIISHQSMPFLPNMLDAFGERLRFVEMVRHPVYMMQHWLGYISRYGTDVREFTICIDAAGRAVPWFAEGFEAQYLASSLVDRSILCMERLMTESFAAYDALPAAQRAQMRIIPFERFVVEPDAYIDDLVTFLDSARTPETAVAMMRQRVPRAVSTAGIGHASYGHTGARHDTEQAEFESRLKEIRDHATPAVYARLAALSNDYIHRFEITRLPEIPA